MAKTNIFDIKKEILYFLRNNDIINISDRGVNTEQDTGTFVTDSTYTLAVTPTLIKNIRNINVGGTDLKYGRDYTLEASTGIITFTIAQTGDYIIDYDVGTNDKIWPDYPQAFLKNKDFPRIGFDFISGTSNEFGIGANITQSEYIMSITFYDKDQDDVENGISTIRNLLMDNKKNFHYIPFLTLTNMGPLLITPFGQNKILQRNQDFMIKFIFEE